MKFGRILRRLRKESEIGIKGLAPRLGVSYSYLSKLENDEVGRLKSSLAGSQNTSGMIGTVSCFRQEKFLQMCWRFLEREP